MIRSQSSVSGLRRHCRRQSHRVPMCRPLRVQREQMMPTVAAANMLIITAVRTAPCLQTRKNLTQYVRLLGLLPLCLLELKVLFVYSAVQCLTFVVNVNQQFSLLFLQIYNCAAVGIRISNFLVVICLFLVHSAGDEDSALHRRAFSAFTKQWSQIVCQVWRLIHVVVVWFLWL